MNQVNILFGRIAGVYDLLNHVLSFGIDRNWRKKLAKAANPGKNGLVLDLAAGTLDVSLALLKEEPTCKVIAIDFCYPMLKRGLSKIKKSNKVQSIGCCVGDALAIPVTPASVDSITIAFGIRNIKERMLAFKQMLQALKPGGKVLILEFGSGQERIWGGVYNIYLNHILPKIGKIVAKDKSAYSYLAQTIRQFPPAAILAHEMEDCGFINVSWQKLTSGIVYMHYGQKPY